MCKTPGCRWPIKKPAHLLCPSELVFHRPVIISSIINTYCSIQSQSVSSSNSYVQYENCPFTSSIIVMFVMWLHIVWRCQSGETFIALIPVMVKVAGSNCPVGISVVSCKNGFLGFFFGGGGGFPWSWLTGQWKRKDQRRVSSVRERNVRLLLSVTSLLANHEALDYIL